MPFGYNGRILHVNLSTSSCRIEEPGEEFYRKYLGGSAINSYYLLKMVPPNIDPLGPDNVLAISVSVTTGAPVAGQSRVAISAKSPLTGLIGDSQSGGFFPAEFKYAGYDAIIISGISPNPAYLWVSDGDFEIRDASLLWGLTSGETEDQIRNELNDPKIQIASIGQAGENLVRFASILNMCNRANGRTGMGAVMGSKKLKAVAVRGIQGKKNFRIAYPKEFKNLVNEGLKKFRGSSLENFGRLGTASVIIPQNNVGGLPTQNFNRGSFVDANNLSGQTLYDEYLCGWKENKQNSLGRDTCFACPIRCKRVVELTDDLIVDKRYGGPEYETIAMMGSNCGINDLKVICKVNELCNKFGLDTISCGGTIAWAMECFEKGIITEEDTDGLILIFGNEEALLSMIPKIAFRQGFGDILADGSAKASEYIQNGSDGFLVTAKNQEYPAHMPRVKRGLGINYFVNSFGADHMSSGLDPIYEIKNDGSAPPRSKTLEILGLTSPTKNKSLDKDKVRFVRITQDYHSMLDSLCWCVFVSGTASYLYSLDELLLFIKFITGWEMTLEELIKVGERKYNMMRLFNAKEGQTKLNDIPSKKMFQPLEGGTSDGYVMNEEQVENAIDEFYKQRGWNSISGNPTQEKLVELGLEWVN